MSQTKAQLISDLVQALNFTGTASAPANGLFLSAANTLQLSTASTPRLTINSDGHVDVVGNLDVGAGIDVTGAITATGDLTITSTVPRIFLTDSNSDSDFAIANSNGVFKINDETNSLNRFSIASDGTTTILQNLDVGAGIDVTGSVNATTDITLASTTTGQCFIVTKNGTQAAKLGHIGTGNEGFLVLKDGGTDTVLLNGETGGDSYINSGNVGIGTASPARKFVVTEATANRVVNITTGGSSGAFVAFLDSNTTDDSKCRVGSKGGNDLALRGDSHSFQDGTGSDKVHIDSSGNVGIGTTSLTAMLTLNKAIPELRLQSSNNNLGMGDFIGLISLHTSDGSTPGAGEVFRIKTESSSSIGADYTTRLYNRNGAGGGATEASFGNGQGSIYLSTNTAGNATPSVRMAIMDDGDVGIGTTSPSTKLHVNGDITAADSIVSANLPGRNFLINGAMQINQRRASPNLTYYNPVTSSIYTLDRWKVVIGSSFDTDSAHIHQSSTTPAGFSSSLKWEIGNTETPSANQNAGIEQKIEAFNLQGLAYGTSSAKTMTLSFHVRSNKTGTYCVQIMQEDGSKYQMHEYTISSSNTWEKKTITIVGNTSNAINNDNGVGLRIIWMLTVGSGDHVAASSTWVSGGDLAATSNQVNLWDNGSNEWYLTGCQLEVGTVATEFEHIDYSDELARCQRYFIQYDRGLNNTTDDGNTPVICNVIAGDGNDCFGPLFLPVCMRTNPTLTTSSADHFQTSRVFSGTQDVGGSILIAYASVAPHQVQYIRVNHSPNPSFSSGESFNLRFKNATAGVLEFNAEL